MSEPTLCCIDCRGSMSREEVDWRTYDGVCVSCRKVRNDLGLLIPEPGAVRLEFDPSDHKRVRMFKASTEVFPVPKSFTIRSDDRDYEFFVSLTNHVHWGANYVFQVTDGKGCFATGDTLEQLKESASHMIKRSLGAHPGP